MIAFDFHMLTGNAMVNRPEGCTSTQGWTIGVMSAYAEEGLTPTTRQIAAHTRTSERTARRIVKQLIDAGHVQRSDSGYIVPEQFRLASVLVNTTPQTLEARDDYLSVA